MYGWDSLVLLQHLLDDGLSKTAIAQRLGVSRRVVHHWIATGQLTRDLDTAPPRHYPPRRTLLAPYEAIITTRLATYPELSAVRLFDEVWAAGYSGGITQVREYVARVRPRPEPEPVVRFETAPGHQAQVDFAEFRLPWGKRYALVVVLGYSRLLWLKFYPRQTLATVISGLEETFAYVGGVPTELLFDQMKAVIIEDQRADGGKLLENPEFLRFAAHWGFRIRACRPYRAKTKGKVERPIRYFRSSFLYGRTFLGDADAQDQCTRWTTEIANQRVHSTLKEIPTERFAQGERDTLLPLAAFPYRSLVLLPETPRLTPPSPHVPSITVERRALTAYTAYAELVAEAR